MFNGKLKFRTIDAMFTWRRKWAPNSTLVTTDNVNYTVNGVAGGGVITLQLAG